jgi:hypothetical protein
MWWNLIPLALGAIKASDDKKAAAAQTQVNAETARWSPWTGVGVDTKVQNPNMAGTMMQAGLTSAQLYQDQQRQKAYQDYLSKQGSQPSVMTTGNSWTRQYPMSSMTPGPDSWNQQ